MHYEEKAIWRQKMLKYMVFILVLIPAFMFSQSLNDEDMFPGDEFWEDEVHATADDPNYTVNGVVGAINIDGTTYSQIRLRPELNIWKFGLGLDIDLLIDSNGRIREEDWDGWQDILGKVLYLRFADRKSPFYFKTGSIPDYTLGHGLIFDDFSNMLQYPKEKNIGGYLGINTEYAGFEFYTHNVFKNEILAGRISAKPLKVLELPLLKNFTLGLNVGMDRNQYGRYPDADSDGYPDVYDKFPDDGTAWLDSDDDGIPDNLDYDLNGNGIMDDPDLNPAVEDIFPGIEQNYPDYPFDTEVYPDLATQYPDKNPIYIYSADYELPLINGKAFTLSNYGEFAMIKDYGNGLIFPGFGAKFLIFEAKLELRHFSEKFLPGYFDHLYDAKRSEVVYALPDAQGRRNYYLISKDRILDNVEPTTGWFGYVRANLWDVVFFKLAYQDMYGDDMRHGKSLWMKLGIVQNYLPKLKDASIFYSQTNVDYIDFTALRNSQANVVGRIVYSISDNVDLVGKYTEFYTDLNNDGRIKGRDEVLEMMNFGVEFAF